MAQQTIKQFRCELGGFREGPRLRHRLNQRAIFTRLSGGERHIAMQRLVEPIRRRFADEKGIKRGHQPFIFGRERITLAADNETDGLDGQGWNPCDRIGDEHFLRSPEQSALPIEGDQLDRLATVLMSELEHQVRAQALSAFAAGIRRRHVPHVGKHATSVRGMAGAVAELLFARTDVAVVDRDVNAFRRCAILVFDAASHYEGLPHAGHLFADHLRRGRIDGSPHARPANFLGAIERSGNDFLQALTVGFLESRYGFAGAFAELPTSFVIDVRLHQLPVGISELRQLFVQTVYVGSG